MTPSRPYLLRALYSWIVDNNLTPHIVINANHKGVVVPREYVDDGQIILSIAPESVYGLDMKNNYIAFAARFAGVSRDIYLPIMSISAIYAEENRKGMVFAEEEEQHEPQDATNIYNKNDNDHGSWPLVKKIKNKGNRPNLKVVSSNPNLDDDNDPNGNKKE